MASKFLTYFPENAFPIGEYKHMHFESYWFDEDENRIIMITKSKQLKVIEPEGDFITMMDCAGYLYKIKYSEFMEYLTN
jgi:hypothetical protein